MWSLRVGGGGGVEGSHQKTFKGKVNRDRDQRDYKNSSNRMCCINDQATWSSDLLCILITVLVPNTCSSHDLYFLVYPYIL